MSDPPNLPVTEVTQALVNAAEEPDGLDRILPLVYRELHRIAARQMRRERGDHTLGATALVHEAYLRLVDQTRVAWRDRAHFFGICAHLMRQVLVDHARKRTAAKRGGGADRAPVDDDAVVDDHRLEELVVLDDALRRLEAVDPRLCRIVEYRFFAGLTESETAELLEVTPRTVQREWRKARAWLYAALYPGDSEAGR